MFTVTFKTSNAAFGADGEENLSYEIARILRKIADRAEEGHWPADHVDEGTIHDVNGNNVGDWKLTADD